MSYENLIKEIQPVKVIETLKKIKDINNKKEENKGKVNLTLLAQKLAKRQLENRKNKK